MSEKIKILLISGSPRAEDDCPGQWSKTAKLTDYLLKNPPDGVEYDSLDLSIRPDKPAIQPCKGCYSTSPFLCHYPCSCYSPNSDQKPDLLHDSNYYSRMEKSHAFVVLTPVHWYGPSTQVKAMFDRSICMNIANPWIQLTDGKNVRKARRLELAGEYDYLRENKLKGHCGAFIIQGDGGANEHLKDGTVVGLGEEDHTFSKHWDQKLGPKNAIMPIVSQCRYMGVHVEDDHILAMVLGRGLPYSVNNSIFETQEQVFDKVGSFMEEYSKFVREHSKKMGLTPKESKHWMNTEKVRKDFLDDKNKPVDDYNLDIK